jgi:hypothetical protein
MTTVHPSPGPELLNDVAHAHRHAHDALDDPAVNSLVAVTWASAHLAAVERVLYPIASRVLPDGGERVRVLRAIDRRLQHLLWRLDRRLTGDVHLRALPVPVLEDDVRTGLREHADGEHVLVTELRRELTAEQQRELSDGLSRALMRAPTRPHPHTRHGRWTGGLAFWIDGVVDRQRDVLDSRSVPTPHRAPVLRPMTRWGAYALGSPAPDRSERRPGP